MRMVLRGFTWLVLLLVVGGVALFLYLRSSLPTIEGEISLEGLSGPVEIVRDRYGVPHIYAESAEDAYFALAFVHAQDRLWQMEFQRHVGAGRVAELVGDRGSAVQTDKFLRTLGVYRAAEANFGELSTEAQDALEAYAAGVNAFLENRSGPLPPEFQIPPIRGHRPEPWRPADSLVWLKMMAWDLGGNWDDELLRARLTTHLTEEQVAQLWPPYPGDAPIALPAFEALYRSLPLDALWANSPKPLPPGAGSNNWVLAGERTMTGAPMLANDPHLGLQTPSLWYFAHLSAPGLEVIGATLPGLPLVVLGHNERIAWGFTNTGPDTQDLFIERLDPDDSNRYLTPEGYREFDVRSEIIKVKGGEDIELTVRESRHGPVISDVVAAAGEVAGQSGSDHVLSFAWTTLRPGDLTLEAGLDLNRAGDWRAFVDALRNFDSPQQNIVYADTEGNIGFYAPGRVPIREGGQGLMPAPGWTGAYDWSDYIPYEDLPHAYNPADGQIATANQKIVPGDYPYFITSDWAEPYRANRILALLGRTDQHSLESMAGIQADQHSRMAAEFKEVLLSVSPETEQGRKAQAMLLDWDGAMARGMAEPLVFAAWYRAFTRAVYADELGDLFEDYWGFRPIFMRNVLDDHPEWCDDVRSEAVESCGLLAARTFGETLDGLNETFGSDMEAWRWGEVHQAYFDHSIFSGSPLASVFDLSIANGGDAFTVNAARFGIDNEDPYEQTSGPGYRALYDLSDLNNSRYIHSTGQSGNPFSRHYRDFLMRWRDVEYLPMTTDRAEIEAGAMGALMLQPR